MQLGKRLADLRRKNNHTQEKLAKKLNVSQQVISNIERNITEPDIDFLRAAADLYHMSMDELIGREFSGESESGYEQKIMNMLEKMDDKGKELSYGLVSQVVQYQGNRDGKE